MKAKFIDRRAKLSPQDDLVKIGGPKGKFLKVASKKDQQFKEFIRLFVRKNRT